MHERLLVVTCLAFYFIIYIGSVNKFFPNWLVLFSGISMSAATGCFFTALSQIDFPVGIGFGIPLGIVLYAVSFFLCNRSFQGLIHRLDGVNSDLAKRIFKQLFNSFWEETFWRGTVLFLTGGPIVGVAISSIAFSCAHFPKVYRFIALLDLFITAVLLSVAYLLLSNICLVVVAHWIRNALIIIFVQKEGVRYDQKEKPTPVSEVS